MTLFHIRSLFWIPHLRRLSKSVNRNCLELLGCKFRSLPYHSPKPGPLPKDKTEKFFSFEVIGTDYVSPIYNKPKRKVYSKRIYMCFFVT